MRELGRQVDVVVGQVHHFGLLDQIVQVALIDVVLVLVFDEE